MNIIPLLSFLIRFIVLSGSTPLYLEARCANTLFETFYHSMLQCLVIELINVLTAAVVVAAKTCKVDDVDYEKRVFGKVFERSTWVSLALWMSTVAALVGASVRGVKTCGKFW